MIELVSQNSIGRVELVYLLHARENSSLHLLRIPQPLLEYCSLVP